MRNPWSAFLLPPPPPPATPGRALDPVWCPVLPPTVTIVTSSPQRNQRTVCIGELVNEMETSDSNPHFFLKVCGRESEWRPYWKVVILGKSWFSDSVFLLQLYFTDLASETLAFGKGMILLQLIYHYHHVSISFLGLNSPILCVLCWHHCKEIQWQYEWTSSMSCFTVSDMAM